MEIYLTECIFSPRALVAMVETQTRWMSFLVQGKRGNEEEQTTPF